MTLPELQAIYPAAANVIAMCEAPGSPWEETRLIAEENGVEAALAVMALGVELAGKEAAAHGHKDTGRCARRDVAEMKTPDFLKYLKAKLGMM